MLVLMLVGESVGAFVGIPVGMVLTSIFALALVVL